MRNNTSSLILVSILFIALQSCALMEKNLSKPSVTFKQTSYRHVSYQKGILTSRIKLFNPNKFGLPIQNITYHLTLNQKNFAQSQIKLDKKIPANGAVEFDLPITVLYKDLAGGIAMALSRKMMTFRLTGEIDLGLIKVPYQQTGQFSLK